MRPRNRLPLASSIVRSSVPSRNARERVREPGHRRGDVPLGGREAGQAVVADERRHRVALELAADHAEAREHPVVAVGDVAPAGGLGDLRVVQFGRVGADVGDRPIPSPSSGAPTMSSSNACWDDPTPCGAARPRPGGSPAPTVVGRLADHDRRSPRASSSMIGPPVCSAPRNFMPSFASDPPATTATRSCTPAATSAPATTRAWTGAAQNAFTSAPLASVSPPPRRPPWPGCRRRAGTGRRSPPRPRDHVA